MFDTSLNIKLVFSHSFIEMKTEKNKNEFSKHKGNKILKIKIKITKKRCNK